MEVFLEINIPTPDYDLDPFDRGEIEDALDEALGEAGLGTVTGGGSGMVPGGLPSVNIDVEITDEAHFDEALAVMRRVLRGQGVPRETRIVRHKPVRAEFPAYD